MHRVLLLFFCFYWNSSFAQNNQLNGNIQNAHISKSWIPLGPFQSSGNYGDIGAIGSIAVVSHKKEQEFLVAPFNGTGGIFQSKNKGITWENVTDSQGLSYLGIAAITQSNKYKNLVVAGINAPLGGIIFNENYGEKGQWKVSHSLERQLKNEAQLAPELYNRQRCIDVLIHPKTYKKKQPLVFMSVRMSCIAPVLLD